MGLDYLNKKVWHPGSMKNIQRVWEVEQVQKEINKKRREREKKLLEEQHNDQLKRIQVEAGLIPRSHLDRMEWMYDWGNKIGQQKTNEEFLTGQREAKPGDRKENKHVFQEEITNRRCEDFQLLHEDPMFEIMRHEKARKDAIVNNPIEMRNIIKEVEKEYLPQDLQQRRKKHTSKIRRTSPSSSRSSSEQRRHKKHKHKKHKHRRHRSPASGTDRQRSRDNSRDKENPRDKEKSRDNEKSREKSPSKPSYKQSKLFKDYIRDRFGGIVREDEDGNLKPDYSVHKAKYRTQYQLDAEDRRAHLEKMKENAKKLEELRERKRQAAEEVPQDFESGVARLRGEMMVHAKENRNHARLRHSDSE